MAIITYNPTSDKLLHKTEVDFSKRKIQKIIHIVQYDKQLPVVEVGLFLNGEPYILPAEMNAQIRWSKKDRTFTYKPVLGCNVDRNTIYFDIDDQMSYYYGDLNPVIELSMMVNEDQLTKGCSQSIPITIDRNPIQNSDLESKINFQYMEEILSQMIAEKEAASQSEANAAESEENAAESEENAAESEESAGESAYDANQAKQIVLEFAADIIAFQAELDSKVAKIRTIAGLDLQDDISVEEIKEAMELLLVDNSADIDKPVSTAQADAIAQAVSDILGGATTYNTLKKITDWIVSLRGNANGICNLDVNAKVPISSLPSEILNSLRYQSGWNANTNVPDLTIIQEKGFYYIVTAAGTRFGKDWEIGDWIVSNGVTWDPIDNTEKLLLGITSTTAGRGDYVKALYDFAQSAIAGGLLKTQLDSKLSKADKYTAPITPTYDAVNEYWDWDYSDGDNALIEIDSEPTTDINIVNATAGDIGVITVYGGQLTLPANSVPSADLGQLTARGNQYYRYSFYFNGTDFEWHRTVLGEEDD